MKPQEPVRAKITVIIPTCNGERYLGALLDSVQAQTRAADEIIVVDSASTDSTLDIVRAYPQVQLLQIERAHFDHGGTRTLVAKMSLGDILVFLTQDAIPANNLAIAQLVAPLEQEGNIAVTYGRQLPHSDASPFAAHLRLFNYPNIAEIPRCFADRARLGLKTIFCSNSFAAYRRKELAEAGFFPERLLLGEDSFAVAKILQLGYCAQYMSEATVFHSHNYTAWEEAKRYFDVGAFHANSRELLQTYGTAKSTGRQFVFSELAYLYTRKHFSFLPLSAIRSGSKLLAYYLGRRAAKLPRFLKRRLSMHPDWWQ